MNKAQKRTWLSLVISLAGLSLGVVAMLNTANAGHRPTFSLLGLTLTIPLISMVILSWRISGKEYDERDKKIERKAVILGTLGVFAYLGGACMLLCVINPMSSIKVGHIIILVYLAAFVWFFISSVVALILYGWTRRKIMNRQQKIARLQLVVIAIAAIAGIVNSWLYMQRYGYTFSEAWWFGTSWPVILCVFAVVLTPIFFRKKKGKISFDERDLIIDRRASRIGFGASYFFFIAVCGAIWVAVGIDTAIPAYWLGRIILGGWLTAAVAHALTTLVCYSFGGKDAGE